RSSNRRGLHRLPARIPPGAPRPRPNREPMVARMSHQPDLPADRSTRKSGCAPSMRRLACLAVAGMVGWPAPGPRGSAAEDAASAGYADEVRPILEQYCYGCHGLGAKKGGVALDGFPDESAALSAPKLWHAVLRNLRSGIMPPAGKPRPSADDRRLLE